MDLNELLYAHQLEVMKASASGDANHIGMIAEYAERIRQLRTVSLIHADRAGSLRTTHDHLWQLRRTHCGDGW